MKLRIVAVVLALSFTAFAQDSKSQAPPPAKTHEQPAKAEHSADAKKDDCCCKKMMKDKDGMKVDGGKSADKEKKETESKTEKKAGCC